LKSTSTVKVGGMDEHEPLPGRPMDLIGDPHAPNHHAGFTGLSGWRGVIAALSMSFGRDRDGELVCELTGVGAHDRVLDVGCGPGTAARAGARRGAEVVGVDPGVTMRRIARLRDPRRTVRYVDGRAEALPVEDGWATAVWTVASVHHWPDVDGGIAEVQRALAPGGRFVAVERSIHAGADGLASHGWTEQQAASFAQRCRAAGFDAHVEHVTGARGPALAVVARRPD
jgi:ubiquinone/menaquinone biosynthesis C-methylase UbiE